MRDEAAGRQTASPSAIPILRTTSCQNLLETPMRMQETENRQIPTPMMIGLFNVSRATPLMRAAAEKV